MTVAPMALQNGVFALRVAGRLDSVTSPELESACDHWTLSGVRKLVLDFSELEYISSAGLRAVLLAAKNMRLKGGEVALCGAAGVVRQVMDMSGFSATFTIYESVEVAFGNC